MEPIPVATQSKACVCGPSLTEIADSNSAVSWMSILRAVCLQRADPFVRGLLPGLCVCVCVCVWSN